MNSALELLDARKQLLVARASLQRLQAAGEVEALRESLRWPRPAVALATSRRGLSLVVAAVFFFLARKHIARAASWASVAVALLRIFRGR